MTNCFKKGCVYSHPVMKQRYKIIKKNKKRITYIEFRYSEKHNNWFPKLWFIRGNSWSHEVGSNFGGDADEKYFITKNNFKTIKEKEWVLVKEEKQKCPCGGHYKTSTRLFKHYETKKHKKYITKQKQ